MSSMLCFLMTERVSIIIPCHNAAPWIAETLESALAQTWPDCEILVVDDGSHDNSASIVDRYAEQGVRLLQQDNRGAAAARNTGIAASTGDYIQFLDADDLLDPDKIAHQVSALGSAPPSSIATAAWARFTNDISQASFNPDPVWSDAAPMDWLVLSWSGGGMMHPAAWLTPRAVVERVGGWNESLSLDDDGEYFARIVLASKSVLHCPAAKVYYRTHQKGSLSQAKSAAAWQSSHRVCLLLDKLALTHEDSPRVRHACALNHLRFAFHAWPFTAARELARSSLDRARQLDPTARRPRSGPRFEMIARLVGWKWARQFQHLFQYE